MLRIVGGRLGGRRFTAPAGRGTRPTTERVREALASVLASRELLEGAQVLELYAGSGALSFEMLSRGAAHALLVERDPRCVRLIEQNIKTLGLAERARALRATLGTPQAVAALAQALPRPATLVLADPPYAEVAAASAMLGTLRAAGVLAPKARIVLEHAHRVPPPLPAGFSELASYRYGDSAVKLWGATDEEP